MGCNYHYLYVGVLYLIYARAYVLKIQINIVLKTLKISFYYKIDRYIHSNIISNVLFTSAVIYLYQHEWMKKK